MTTKSHIISIDYSRDSLLTPFSVSTLQDRYMLPAEKSPQEAFARAAEAFADDDEHAQRLYDYASKLWFMFSTPVLANGGTKRGLPISCFLNYVPDSIDGLAANILEDIHLTTSGGGIGSYFGHVRSDGEATKRGTKSTGIIGFIKVIESLMLAYSQGSNRRGAASIYLDISHPEIEEFINMRKPGGDANRKALNRKVFHHAVNIPDSFMDKIMQEDDSWPLIDPHSKDVRKVVSARELWIRLLETRMETGEPYLHFIDTSNKYLPEALKAKGLRIHQSNLCSEIILPTNEYRTAVCCLSSVNLEKFDEWKDDPLFIEDLIRMLDNVLDGFIKSASWKKMERAIRSATMERSLGLGAMGFASYLQSKNIPFESAMASSRNRVMFQHIYEQARAASKKLATERGEAPDMEGTGLRNAHLIAIAPNASSGIIAGTSPGIEPEPGNVHVKKTDTGTTYSKNKHLEKLLEQLGKNTKEVWDSVLFNNGSVQHLDFLSEHAKDVFKTAFELDQSWIVDHAGSRQPFIDQAQSVNLFFNPGVDKSVLHRVHYEAWQKELKTLYYLRSGKAKAAENIASKVERNHIIKPDDGEPACLSCES